MTRFEDRLWEQLDREHGHEPAGIAPLSEPRRYRRWALVAALAIAIAVAAVGSIWNPWSGTGPEPRANAESTALLAHPPTGSVEPLSPGIVGWLSLHPLPHNGPAAFCVAQAPDGPSGHLTPLFCSPLHTNPSPGQFVEVELAPWKRHTMPMVAGVVPASVQRVTVAGVYSADGTLHPASGGYRIFLVPLMQRSTVAGFTEVITKLSVTAYDGHGQVVARCTSAACTGAVSVSTKVGVEPPGN